ncbi:MAG: MCP four helix bundle domain-containing protein [Anaeromyxobacter sp.]|nr:MCP four helix bundle domain-containing protein [Anaeromyxobacter sp.]
MFANLKMGTKILAGFALAVAILLVVGGISYSGSQGIEDRLEEASHQKIPSLVALALVGEGQVTLEASLRTLLNRRLTVEEHRYAQERVRKALEEIDGGAKAYEAMPHGDSTQVLWRTWRSEFASWRPVVEQVASAIADRDRLVGGGADKDAADVAVIDGRAWSAFAASEATYRKAAVAIDAVQEKTRTDAARNGEEGLAAGSRALTTIVVSILLAAVLLLAIGVFLGKKIGNTVTALVGEAGKLREAVQAGQLGVRGDEAAVEGEFRPIIAGINETMAAVERPTRMVVECVSRIGKGDIPPKITERYQGDFDLIKGSLNDCIDAVNALVADASTLAKAGVEGRLATRADASKHQGDFRKVVAGVNDTLDAVIGPLNVAARYVDQISKGRSRRRSRPATPATSTPSRRT